ncbi:unnamed protein product [Vicia faba]|uniref:Uncharacterized protein n=1 Tax=Vicia faba TaxID=3906 RepID=A0AAV1AC15_VICFA|nr:unnamed protein product [Vicia faba]
MTSRSKVSKLPPESDSPKGEPKQNKNLRRYLTNEVSKIKKKHERGDKLRSVEATKAKTIIDCEGSSMSTTSSKRGKTSEATMKKSSRKKEPDEKVEYDSDVDMDYIEYLNTYKNDEDHA